MVTCPTCNGSGTQKISITDFSVKSGNRKLEIDCQSCNGSGVISHAEHEHLTGSMWCKCDNKNTNGSSYYVAPGWDSNITSRHWRCKECNKVTQIDES